MVLSYSTLDFNSTLNVVAITDFSPTNTFSVIQLQGVDGFPGIINSNSLDQTRSGILILSQVALTTIGIDSSNSLGIAVKFRFDARMIASNMNVINGNAVIIGIFNPYVNSSNPAIANSNGIYMQVINLSGSLINSPFIEILNETPNAVVFESGSIQETIFTPPSRIPTYATLNQKLNPIIDCKEYFYIILDSLDTNSLQVFVFNSSTFQRIGSKIYDVTGFNIASVTCIPSVLIDGDTVNGLMMLFQTDRNTPRAEYAMFVDAHLGSFKMVPEITSSSNITFNIAYSPIKQIARLRLLYTTLAGVTRSRFSVYLEDASILLSSFMNSATCKPGQRFDGVGCTLCTNQSCEGESSQGMSTTLQIIIGCAVSIFLLLLVCIFLVVLLRRRSKFENESPFTEKRFIKKSMSI